LLDAAPQPAPYFTHGTLRFCIPTMGLNYQTLGTQPVASSGYMRKKYLATPELADKAIEVMRNKAIITLLETTGGDD
jgi:hypothetical protein